jgi:hypothetical protein
MTVMDRNVGFITCSPRDAGSWCSQLNDQFQRLFEVGRTNIVVMLDTLPAPDAQTVAFLVEFREAVLNAGADCTFVALHSDTIAALRAFASVGTLPIIQRIEDIPARRDAA